MSQILFSILSQASLLLLLIIISQVNELVESVIQSRQDLTYKGPTLVTNRRLCNTTATTKEN